MKKLLLAILLTAGSLFAQAPVGTRVDTPTRQSNNTWTGIQIYNPTSNGVDILSSTRQTDTLPTGNFINFKSLAGISLWQIDITGTLQAGTVPLARTSGTLAILNGGTGQASASAAFNALNPMTTLGDTIFESAANTASRLPGNTTTTKQYLSQTGTGTVSAAPVWAQIAFLDISGLIAASQLPSTPGKQIFTASGTFTIPTGVTAVKVTIVGGGAAGGGSTNGTAVGSGGGAGAAAIKWLTGLTPGNTITVTVGTGGTGVSGGTGGNGTASSIASGTQVITTVTSGGGAGGINTGGSVGAGGAGGTATNGDLNFSGARGGSAYVLGGGSQGSSSIFGGDPGSSGTATTFGAGGGGANSVATAAGGGGANGVVIFEWTN